MAGKWFGGWFGRWFGGWFGKTSVVPEVVETPTNRVSFVARADSTFGHRVGFEKSVDLGNRVETTIEKTYMKEEAGLTFIIEKETGHRLSFEGSVDLETAVDIVFSRITRKEVVA